MFTSAAIIDPYDVLIIQQCRMLESITGTSVLKLCLELLRIAQYLSRPVFSHFSCPMCDVTLTPTTT